MKFKIGLACALAGACAVPVVARAGSATDRATGGGQVLVGDRGAGDTIAFTARGSAGSATGQVQYQDREGGTGQGQTTYHGDVACLRVEGNMAKIGGSWRDGGTFQILIVDDGQGAKGNDMVTLQNGDPEDCAEEDDDDEAPTALARGNAQVYDASAQSRRRARRSKARATAPTLSYTKAVSLAGLN